MNRVIFGSCLGGRYSRFSTSSFSRQVRFLARSFGVPGNHLGRQSHGFHWPYGPVALVTPFNFPLGIPVLQLLGALTWILRLLHYRALPAEDVDFINSDERVLNKLLSEVNPCMTLFAGRSRVAEKLAIDLNGRIKLEDARFRLENPGT